jgi:hypothetical protein
VWGPRATREKGHEHEGNRANKPGPPGSGRETERVCADAGARGLAGPSWAKKSFSFSREFLIAFLFIFSRVFNTNSNQVSNSN